MIAIFTVQGIKNTAVIYTLSDLVDKETISQIKVMCDMDALKDSIIRVMPDCHPGKNCLVGTTIFYKNAPDVKIIPSFVGTDIGCGMLAIKLKETKIDLPKLDSIIRKSVPSGSSVYTEVREHRSVDLSPLRCLDEIRYKSLVVLKCSSRKLKIKRTGIRLDNAYKSVGTLGGGNHFIELGKDSNGSIWLIIHTGSRGLGKDVCEYYQNLAYLILQGYDDTSKIPYELSYLTGAALADYLYDMQIVQSYAICNRHEIARVILQKARLTPLKEFDCMHNYIDLSIDGHMILRKGAISARANEMCIIPINSRDGTLICTGLGNPDWNYSAPHGSGRRFSRKESHNRLSVSEYKRVMKESGVYTTSVSSDTLEESPMSYRSLDEIMPYVQDTVRVLDIIHPIYNFKVGKQDSSRGKQRLKER